MIFNEQLEKFYETKNYFSYSAINKLLYSPKVFYNHYILKEREDSTDAHLVAGKAIHCLLLEENTFEKQFLIIPGKLPTGNNKTVVDKCFQEYENQPDDTLKLDDFEGTILETLVSINVHQTLKTDAQRVEKILIDNNKEYFEFLKSRNGKTLISQEMYDECLVTVAYVKDDERVKSLLQLETPSTDSFKVLNEEFLEMDLENSNFGLKGVLDNVVIDYHNKTLFVNDLKTTAKPIQEFGKTVDYYNYWIQGIIYKRLAIHNYLKDLKDKDNWTVHLTFIVIDKFNSVYPFQVSEKTLNDWEDKFKEIVDRVTYHYDTKDYTLPYELALGNFKL